MVLAGETIAVDGVIIKGQTSVDQSIMTGESLKFMMLCLWINVLSNKSIFYSQTTP
jgi:hypothetical protein